MSLCIYRSIPVVAGITMLSIAASQLTAASKPIPLEMSSRQTTIVSEPFPAQDNSRANKSQDGRGTLRIVNGTDKDAVAKLTDSASGKARHVVYIKAYGEVTIRGIAPCDCILKVATGIDWDRKAQQFMHSRSFFQFNDRLRFRETTTASGTEWTTYLATLHPVEDGDALTTPISASSF